MTLDETFKAAKAGDLTNDTTYKVGEISRKTGLQKQPDGSWAPPRKTNYGKVTTNKNGEVGIQQTLGKGSKFEKFGSEKEAARALGNYTAGYNTTERSKEDPHSNEALLHKHWDKEVEKTRKENKQNGMKNEVLEYLSHSMPKEKAEAFLDAAEPKTLRTMYNNLKYKIPGENKKLHEKESAASNEAEPETSSPAFTGTDGKGNKVEVKVTESRGGGFYIDKYVNGKHVGISGANSKEDAESKAKDMLQSHLDQNKAASSEENSTMTHAKAMADNEQKKQAEGQAYLEQSVSGYSDQSLKQAASTYTRNLEEFDEDIKSYLRRDLAPAQIAKRINSANFAKGALKAINAEIEARSKKNNPAASNEPDPVLSEKDLHSIYMDIKNNELEDFSTEQIQKEYKITRGDAAAIKARIENNKRAREQDRRERSAQDAAYTAQSVNAPRENLERKLTGDCKIRIRK